MKYRISKVNHSNGTSYFILKLKGFFGIWYTYKELLFCDDMGCYELDKKFSSVDDVHKFVTNTYKKTIEYIVFDGEIKQKKP